MSLRINNMNFPKRPLSHVSGDEAVSIFTSACPSEWVVSPIQPDYGLDLRIEITRNTDVTGEEFYVQLKGRQKIFPLSNGKVKAPISQSTINYWLGKLNPVLIVLVDVPNKCFWFDWLENAYENYPHFKAEQSEVTLTLRHKNTDTSLENEIPKYLTKFFSNLKENLSKYFENNQIVRMLFHVTELWNVCSEMVIFLKSDTKDTDESVIITYWHLFYQQFGMHDLFIRIPWLLYAGKSEEPTNRIILALESRFLAYEKVRATFYNPEDATQFIPDVPLFGILPLLPSQEELETEFQKKKIEMKLQYVKPKYHELLENIFPTMNVLKSIQEILFHILLIGRVKFKDDE